METGSDDSLVSFDTEHALETVQEHVGGALLVCAEYTPTDFRICYLSDRIEAAFESSEAVTDAGEMFHHYSQLDFVEGDTFADFYPTLSETYAFATYTDFATIIRVVGDDEGLYVSVENGTEITPAIDAITELVT
jgi:hypothetical protein